MRCLITGTRYGRADVWHWMRRFVKRFGVPTFVLGGAPGVDTDAAELCMLEDWPSYTFFAQWRPGGIYNPRAGFQRNERMVRYCKPGDWCLAFPSGVQHSRGTWHCAGLANDARLKVFVVPHVRVLRPLVHVRMPPLAA